MTSIRLPESVGLLTKTSSTVVSLAASRINIGGQQYVTVNPLTLSVGTIGAGGVDATLTGNSLYYVYAVVSAGAMALVGSKVSTLPAGFTSARLVGHFNTDGALNINRALAFMVLDREQASLANSDLRNLIINGNFDLFQRGTSLTLTTSNLYLADRFNATRSSIWTGTYSQSSNVPTQAQSGFQSKNSLLITNGTGAATTTGTIYFIESVIEGQDYQAVHSKSVRFQFWIKSSVAGTYSVSFSNATRDRYYVASYTVNSANTWEKKSIDVVMDAAGTWAFDNTAGLRVRFLLASDSTFQTGTPGTWQTGNLFGTSANVNWAATTGATFQLAQVSLYQVDANGLDLPFYRHGKDIQQELAACQRYYEGIVAIYFRAIAASATYNNSSSFPFAVEKRATPTVTIYGIGQAPNVYDKDGIGNTSVASSFVSARSFSLSLTAGSSGNFGFTAEAEL